MRGRAQVPESDIASSSRLIAVSLSRRLPSLSLATTVSHLGAISDGALRHLGPSTNTGIALSPCSRTSRSCTLVLVARVG